MLGVAGVRGAGAAAAGGSSGPAGTPPSTGTPPSPTGAPPGPATGTGQQTPVLSLRRAPQLVRTGVALSRLDTAVDSALSDTTLQKSPAASCLVVQAGSTLVYQRNPTTALVPASNLKLLTATAVLDKLPASQRFVTSVLASAAPNAGKVTGNLYLVGGGDPLLFTADFDNTLSPAAPTFDDLAALATKVKQAGITTVTGSVVGDESRYDSQRGAPTWPASYLATGQVGPLSALLVNDGFAMFKPAPVPAPNPAQQAAATFTMLLAAQGVMVAGPAAAGNAPAGAQQLAQLTSPPLPQIVDEMLLRSDNDTAELLTKELGRQMSGHATTTAGTSIITADLASDGLPTDGLHLVDGSGLDRGDRATCTLMLAALNRSGPTGSLAAGLPVAGKTGTLAARMLRTAAVGRLRAKTGTLNGVSSLSGFVAPSGPASLLPGVGQGGITFSLISNSVPTDVAGSTLGDRVGLALAAYPDAPALSDLSPLP